MNRIVGLSLPVLLGLTLLSGRPSAAKPPATKAPPAADKGAMTKVTGPVKGAPSGKTFTVAVPRKGNVTVDGTGAKVRINGRFASMDAVKAGTMVTVSGTMNGTTLAAKEIEVHGGKKTGAKEGGASTAPPGGTATPPKK